MSLEPTLTVVATGKDIFRLLKVLSDSGLGHLIGETTSEPKNDFDKRDPILIEEKVESLELVVAGPVYKDNEQPTKVWESRATENLGTNPTEAEEEEAKEARTYSPIHGRRSYQTQRDGTYSHSEQGSQDSRCHLRECLPVGFVPQG